MRAPVLTLASSLALATVALAACGDSSTGSGGAGGNATTSTGTGSSSSKASTSTATGTGTGGGASCDEPVGAGSAALNVGVTSIQGSVVDTAGAAASTVPVQVCGKNKCLYGTTSASGSVTVTNDGSNLDRPLFKVGDGLTTARSAYPITTPTATVMATVQSMTDSAKAFTAGTTLTAANASLEIAAGGTAGFAIEFGDPAMQTFRAGEVPTAKIADIATGQTFVGLWGFGPIETVLCPPAKLTVKNDTGLAANAAVEFYLQELNTGEGFGTYGDWVKVADGAVSADGATISTNAGSGIPELGLIGIKAK